MALAAVAAIAAMQKETGEESQSRGCDSENDDQLVGERRKHCVGNGEAKVDWCWSNGKGNCEDFAGEVRR